MSNSPEESAELARLLSRSAQRDAAAFADLYQRTSPRLLALCLRILRERSEAEEVLQEVYVTVWQRADQFDAALASASTWLATLARNKAIDRLRQRRVRVPQEPIDADELADEQPGPPLRAEASQEYRRLQQCLSLLQPRDQRSIREAFFSGATYKELAERCRMPLATLKSRIRRALAQLRTCLES